MTGFGPLFQLQLYGSICPCLESSENQNARQSLKSIHTLCRRVLWHPSKNTGTSSAKGLLGSWFGRGGNQEQTANESSSEAASSGTAHTEPCLARLMVRDSSEHHQPELFVKSLGGMTAASAQNTKLRRVDKVQLDDNQIVLLAKPNPSGEAKELLRFTVLQYNEDQEDANAEIVPVSSDDRNMLVHHWMVLVEWERQRRADSNEDDDSDDEDDHQTNFLQARAQKAAHFAKREIEMKRMKKDREQRKAKLISEAGGLKYTALAMAKNNS